MMYTCALQQCYTSDRGAIESEYVAEETRSTSTGETSV